MTGQVKRLNATESMKRPLLIGIATALVLLGIDARTVSAQAVAATSSTSINGRIVFDSSRPPAPNGLRLIWSIAADGSDLHGPLTATDVFVPDQDSGQAVFSPDGTKIAYYTKNFAGGGGDLPCCGEIAVMNPDGTNRQLLINGHGTTGCGFNGAPTWSPDGGAIAFVTCDITGHTAIGVVNADGTGFRFLLTTANFNAIYHPSWSPGGGTIVFTHLDAGDIPHIVSINADGTGGETELGIGYDPAWSPDGTKIAFSEPAGENDTGIWVMNADGSGAVRLTSLEDAQPAWSPDGTMFVFTSRRDGLSWQLYTMNADGSNQTLISTARGETEVSPSWGRAPAPTNLTITDCNDPALTQVTSVSGSFTIDGVTGCTSIDDSALVNVGGDLTVTNTGSMTINLGNVNAVAGTIDVIATGTTTVNLGNVYSVGGNVDVVATGSTTVNLGNVTAVAGNVDVVATGTTNISLGSLQTVAGDLTVGSDTASTVVNLGAGASVGGNITLQSAADTVSLGTTQAAGSVTLVANGSNSVSAITGGTTTDVTVLGGIAAMRVVLPPGAFSRPVPFTITRQTDLGAQTGSAPDGAPALIQPVGGYLFSFAIPTLNADAQLAFRIDLSQLDAETRAAVLAGVQDGTATIATQGDAAGSAYQSFATCTGVQTPQTDGCVVVTLIDANGSLVTDPALAAFVNLAGVAGHFSTWSVVLVEPVPDTTPPTLAPAVTPNPVVLNATATASANASDSGSGIATSSCDAVDTSRVGSHTVNCIATDKAGNTTNASVGYQVVYSTGSCLGEPGHQVLAPLAADGSSVFREDRTIPVKFRVCDAKGQSIGTPGVVTSFRLVQIVTRTGTQNVDLAPQSRSRWTTFRWDPAGRQWVFDLSTERLREGAAYLYEMRLNDGSAITFRFRVREDHDGSDRR